MQSEPNLEVENPTEVLMSLLPEQERRRIKSIFFKLFLNEAPSAEQQSTYVEVAHDDTNRILIWNYSEESTSTYYIHHSRFYTFAKGTHTGIYKRVTY